MRSNRSWIGEPADAQRKAAAGGMADQRQRLGRRGLADDADEIGKVVLELADIADVAARA